VRALGEEVLAERKRIAELEQRRPAADGPAQTAVRAQPHDDGVGPQVRARIARPNPLPRTRAAPEQAPATRDTQTQKLTRALHATLPAATPIARPRVLGVRIMLAIRMGFDSAGSAALQHCRNQSLPVRPLRSILVLVALAR
jgi:hypothetical protein